MILVTGGAGFIGSNIVAALTALGDREVAVCDWLGDADKWRNLAKHEVTQFVTPDKLMGFLKSEAHRIDSVIHMGAISDTRETNVDKLIQTNYQLSLDLWEWCAKNEAVYIYASSGATYGDGGAGFDDDGSMAGLAKLRPLNPYGWSKHLFDRRVARMVAEHAPQPTQWAGLKFFNVYGPNEYHKGSQASVALQIHDQMLLGDPVKLFRSHNPEYPDGGQRRDFIWIEDCVAVVQWLLDDSEASGIFNVGTGESRTFLDLATAVSQAMKEPLNVQFIDMPEEMRDRYQYFTEAKVERLRDAGFTRAFTPLEEGVRLYVQQYLSQPEPFR
jgi:ADP-L-glycero-D-manno-heptose 6-epimerase